MTSRKQRKRDRRRAEATARSPFWQQKPGGGGQPLKRGDVRLIAHAVNDGWRIAPEKRPALVNAIHGVIVDAATPRLTIAGVCCAVAMTEANLRAQVAALRAKEPRHAF